MQRILRKIFDAIIDFFKSVYGFFKKKRVSVVCAVLFSVLVGTYVVAHIAGGFSEKMTITPATLASENVYETYDAFIFRDENVISSDYSGYRLDIMADGEMVGIGTEYARVYPTAAPEDFDLSLELLSDMIALMERCCVLLTASGIESARQTLSEGYKSIAEALSRGNALEASGLKNTLSEAYSTLSVNKGTSETVEENLKALREEIKRLEGEKENLIASLGTGSVGLTAEKTGYYYSGVDGYESLMSSKDIGKKSFDELNASVEALKNGEASVSGVCRMVYDPHWYAALPVDMSVAVKYMTSDGTAKNQKYEIAFFDGEWKTLDMVLERVVASDDGRAMLIFSSSVMDVGFSLGRSCRARIHVGEYEGYRVPLRALHEKDGKAGVYVLVYGTVEWRYVDEIYRGDSYILVKAHGADEAQSGKKLALNESLIVEGRDLYDGKTVD